MGPLSGSPCRLLHAMPCRALNMGVYSVLSGVHHLLPFPTVREAAECGGRGVLSRQRSVTSARNRIGKEGSKESRCQAAGVPNRIPTLMPWKISVQVCVTQYGVGPKSWVLSLCNRGATCPAHWSQVRHHSEDPCLPKRCFPTRLNIIN